MWPARRKVDRSTPQSVPTGLYFEPWLHEITVTDSCERLFQTFGTGSNGSGYPFEKKVIPWSGSGYPFERNVIRCKTRLRNSASSTNQASRGYSWTIFVSNSGSLLVDSSRDHALFQSMTSDGVIIPWGLVCRRGRVTQAGLVVVEMYRALRLPFAWISENKLPLGVGYSRRIAWLMSWNEASTYWLGLGVEFVAARTFKLRIFPISRRVSRTGMYSFVLSPRCI